LRQGSSSEVQLLQKAIEQGSAENLSDIMEIIESTGAIEYTANAAKTHAEKAHQKLLDIPDSPYRDALKTLAEFVVDRSY
jgi:octaprenyl-diphosphate synthase